MNKQFLWVAGLLLGLACWRIDSLRSSIAVGGGVRDWRLVRSQAFDTDGRLGVDAGPDGRPGIAWVDDGANGIVDDDAELGATGSDDRLIVVSGDQFVADPHRIRAVLQRGVWIDVADTGATDTGATDTGATDTGATDTGATDTGATRRFWKR